MQVRAVIIVAGRSVLVAVLGTSSLPGLAYSATASWGVQHIILSSVTNILKESTYDADSSSTASLFPSTTVLCFSALTCCARWKATSESWKSCEVFWSGVFLPGLCVWASFRVTQSSRRKSAVGQGDLLVLTGGQRVS